MCWQIMFALIFSVARMIGGPYLTYVTLSADNPLLIKVLYSIFCIFNNLFTLDEKVQFTIKMPLNCYLFFKTKYQIISSFQHVAEQDQRICSQIGFFSSNVSSWRTRSYDMNLDIKHITFFKYYMQDSIIRYEFGLQTYYVL